MDTNQPSKQPDNWTAHIPRWLGGLPLAIFLMSLLGLACILATFHESRHGAASTRQLFYRSWWFDLLLVGLFVNVLAATLQRYPWRRTKPGFVTTHLGILVLMLGALVSLQTRMEGRLVLATDETINAFPTGHQRIRVTDSSGRVSLDTRFDLPHQDVVFPYNLTTNKASNQSLWVHDAASNGGWQTNWLPSESGPAVLEYRLLNRLEREFFRDTLVLMPGVAHQSELGPLRLQITPPGITAHDAGEENAWQLLLELPRRGEQQQHRLPSQSTAAQFLPINLGVFSGTLAIDRWLPSATAQQTYSPHLGQGLPALRMAMSAEHGSSELVWVALDATAEMVTDHGTQQLACYSEQHPLGFDLKLKEFRIVTYPGTDDLPMSYESDLWLKAPDSPSQQQTLKMNQPVDFGRWRLYQTAYQHHPEREELLSVLTVSRDPGIPFIYAGGGLLGLGAAMMAIGRSPIRSKSDKPRGAKTQSQDLQT